MFFILTDGISFVDRLPSASDSQWYEEKVAALAGDQCVEMRDLPHDLRSGFQPVLASLLCLNPARRLSVDELLQNRWLMDEEE